MQSASSALPHGIVLSPDEVNYPPFPVINVIVDE